MAVLLAPPGAGRAALAGATPEGARDDATGSQLTELNKKITNPVSNIWSLAFQQNNYYLDDLKRWQSNLQVQPLLPVALTREWNLITRPVIQIFNSIPYRTALAGGGDGGGEEEIRRTTGLGDSILAEMLSPGPELVGNWIIGLGPTFVFPSASTDWTGAGKWQAGPAVLFGYMSKKWILGAFVQNWTSFAGDHDRADTSQMNIQPITAYFFGQGWSIGYSGNILADWRARASEAWTIPLGASIGKVVKIGRLPLKIGLSGQYFPLRPDVTGPKWNIQFAVTPVLPKLIRGEIFAE